MKKVVFTIIGVVGVLVAVFAQPFELEEGIYLNHHDLITNQVNYPIGELDINYKQKKHGNLQIRKVKWFSPAGEQELDTKEFYALVMGSNLYIQYGFDDSSITFGKQSEGKRTALFTPIHFRGQYGYVFIEEDLPKRYDQAITEYMMENTESNKLVCQKLYNMANGRLFDFSKTNILRIIESDRILTEQLENNKLDNWRVLLHTLEQYEKRKKMPQESTMVIKF